MRKRLAFSISIMIISGILSSVYAQIDLLVFSTVGTNPVDNPVYVNVGNFSQIYYKKVYLNYGFDFNLTQREIRPFNAFQTECAYQFNIKDNALLIGGRYLYKPSTELVKERNLHFYASYNMPHWKIHLGTNFKSFKLNNSYAENLEDQSTAILKERPGITYRLQFYLFNRYENERNYNINFMITNIDWFIIEQETNPFVGAGFYYDFKNTNITIYNHLFYQTAGFNNIRVNYFGLYNRIGLKWNIEY
ncbi:MAG: hypothetical protein C0596_17645 [Marinilabiliales bacterium]|nr:MAG: hypothetical protein C0596_17645 [Marinilabiliales bacterium]